MKIVIGLGNPGKQYEHTRHNIGFDILDDLLNRFEFPEFVFNKKFNAEISEGKCQLLTVSQRLVLVKPQTFMNLSGNSVRSILDFYKLTPADIIVIHDDVDIEIGTLKIATDSRSAGHNGVQNIIDQIGTQKFTRLRIGIGATTADGPTCRIGVHDFVLGKFTKQEDEKNHQLFETIADSLTKLLADEKY